MVDGLHIIIWNRRKKPLAIALSGAGKVWKGRDSGSDLTNVQHNPNLNCYYDSSLYKEYITIKDFIIKKKIILNIM
jgi:hypothetical protein